MGWGGACHDANCRRLQFLGPTTPNSHHHHVQAQTQHFPANDSPQVPHWSEQSLDQPGYIPTRYSLSAATPGPPQSILSCVLCQRGPRIGGFYGIPAANDTTKGSHPRRPHSNFILCTAYYRGCAASFLAWGGISNPVRAFPSQNVAQKFFHSTEPQPVRTLPAIMPYI
jgi:hypothetical protein